MNSWPSFIGGGIFMSQKKYKRNYFPLLRKLMKELEDSIIERKIDKEKKAKDELIKVLNEIEKSEHLED